MKISRMEVSLHKLGAVDDVQADVVRIGGITEWLKVAHMADVLNLKVATNSYWNSLVRCCAASPTPLFWKTSRSEA
jgi:L-alanine-DL-glutamate epimerase-like enolase superfamily enzyme